MCYVCDYTCCSASSGEHCGCEHCPQPLCHTHSTFAREIEANTGAKALTPQHTTELRQDYKEEMVRARRDVLTARENVILTTGRLYPEPGQLAQPAPPFAATRPDEQPGFRVTGGNLMQDYVPPPLDQGVAIPQVIGRPDVGTTIPQGVKYDGWGEPLGVDKPILSDEGVELPPEEEVGQDRPPEIEETTGNFLWGNTYDGTEEAGPLFPVDPYYPNQPPADDSGLLYPDTTEYHPGEHLPTPDKPVEYAPPPPDHPIFRRGPELGEVE